MPEGKDGTHKTLLTLAVLRTESGVPSLECDGCDLCQFYVWELS
jgi:hypothetical protein